MLAVVIGAKEGGVGQGVEVVLVLVTVVLTVDVLTLVTVAVTGGRVTVTVLVMTYGGPENTKFINFHVYTQKSLSFIIECGTNDANHMKGAHSYVSGVMLMQVY